MGIHGLYQWLKEILLKCPENVQKKIVEPMSMSAFRGKNVGIDANIFLCPVFYTIEPNVSDGRVIEILTDFVCNHSQQLKIMGLKHVVWCFDGESPISKHKTIQKRQEVRSKIAQRASQEQENCQKLQKEIEIDQQKIEQANGIGYNIDKNDLDNNTNDNINIVTKEMAIENKELEKQQAYKKMELVSQLHEMNQHLKYSRRLTRSMLKQVQEKVYQWLHLNTEKSENENQTSGQSSTENNAGCTLTYIHILQCISEADYQLTAMAKHKMVDLVLSGDSDALACNIQNLCRNIPTIPFEVNNGNNNFCNDSNSDSFSDLIIPVYHTFELLNYLSWTEEMFLDFCLLLGHDEDDMRMKGIGPAFAQKLIQEYKSIDQILIQYKNYKEGNEQKDEGQQVTTVRHKRKSCADESSISFKKIKEVPNGYSEYLQHTRQMFSDPPFTALDLF